MRLEWMIRYWPYVSHSISFVDIANCNAVLHWLIQPVGYCTCVFYFRPPEVRLYYLGTQGSSAWILFGKNLTQQSKMSQHLATIQWLILNLLWLFINCSQSECLDSSNLQLIMSADDHLDDYSSFRKSLQRRIANDSPEKAHLFPICGWHSAHFEDTHETKQPLSARRQGSQQTVFRASVSTNTKRLRSPHQLCDTHKPLRDLVRVSPASPEQRPHNRPLLWSGRRFTQFWA